MNSALITLLCELFPGDELPRLVRGLGPRAAEALIEIRPHQSTPLRPWVADLLDQLARRELLEAFWNRMVEQRPERVEEIQALAQVCSVKTPPDVVVLPDAPAPVRYLTGRDDVITRVCQRLRDGQVVVLIGPPGVGKTQIARACADTIARTGTAPRWINAEDPEAVHRVLTGSRELWASPIILDNVTDAKMAGTLVSCARSALLTSQAELGWAGIAVVERISGLERADSFRLLETLTGETSHSDAAALHELFDGHPLALVHATFLCSDEGISIREVVVGLQAHQGRLLTSVEPRPEYPATLPVVVRRRVARLAEVAPDAAVLLELLTYLAGDLPRSALAPVEAVDGCAPDVLAILAEPTRLRSAITALGRSGFAAPTGGTISLHRLIASLIREELPAPRAEVLRITALRAICERQHESVSRRDWELCKQLFPPVYGCLIGATAEDIRNAVVFEAGLHSIGRLNEWGLYDAACALSGVIALRAREAFGPFDTRTLHSLNRLGVSLQKLHKIPEATKVFEAAYAIARATFGLDHDVTEQISHNLGFVYSAAGREEALPYLERAVANRRANGTPEALAAALQSLGGWYLIRDDPKKALMPLRESVEILRVYGPVGAPEWILGFLNLADALVRLGDHEQAGRFLDEIAVHAEALRTGQHPYYLAFVATRVGALHAGGSPQGAFELAREALGISEGWDAVHREVLLVQAANAAEELGRLPESERYWREIVDHFSAMDQSASGASQRLVGVLDAQGRRGDAWVELRAGLLRHRAQVGFEVFFGQLRKLARASYEAGDFERAEPLYRWCTDISKEDEGGGPAERAFWLNGLAVILSRRGRPEEAVVVLEEALSLAPTDPTDRRHVLPEVYLNLASAKTLMGQLVAARADLLTAIQMVENPRYKQETRVQLSGLANLALADLAHRAGDRNCAREHAIAAERFFREFLPDTHEHRKIARALAGHESD